MPAKAWGKRRSLSAPTCAAEPGHQVISCSARGQSANRDGPARCSAGSSILRNQHKGGNQYALEQHEEREQAARLRIQARRWQCETVLGNQAMISIGWMLKKCIVPMKSPKAPSRVRAAWRAGRLPLDLRRSREHYLPPERRADHDYPATLND
jgi:hypothetical protein